MDDDTTSTFSNGRTIVDISLMLEFISRFRCPELGCGDTISCNERKEKRKGFSIFIEAFCPVCNSVVAETYTSSRIVNEENRKSQPFSVNKAAVFSSMRDDSGPYRLNNLCESLDMPSLSKA